MKVVKSSRRFSIATVGNRAKRVMAGDAEKTVLAVFERSFYVEDSQQQLACIGGLELGFGPLHALLATGVAVNTSTLSVGTRVTFDAANAILWRPERLAIPHEIDLRQGLRVLAGILSGKVRPRGLMSDCGRDPWSENLRQGVHALRGWMAASLQGDPGTLPLEVERIVGLGSGLTPSGDDALAGALIALRELALPGIADALAIKLLPIAREHTSRISFAHLEAAAEGEGAECLHAAIHALILADETALAASLTLLDRLGHTSGWDAFAGVLAVVESRSDNLI